jgi:hypothetical protein
MHFIDNWLLKLCIISKKLELASNQALFVVGLPCSHILFNSLGNCRSITNYCAVIAASTFSIGSSMGFDGLVFVVAAVIAMVTVPLVLAFKKIIKRTSDWNCAVLQFTFTFKFHARNPTNAKTKQGHFIQLLKRFQSERA